MSGDERTCGRADDAVALALHALEPDEEATMREHVAGCPSCQEELAAAELVATALAGGVEQVDPPAGLRANILAQAAQTPQATSAPPPGAAGAAGPAPAEYRRHGGRERAGAATGPGRSGTGSGGPGRAGVSGPGRRGRRLVAAALVLVAVVGVVAVGGLAAHAARLQQQRDAQIAQTQALVDVLTQLDRPGTSHATLSTSEGRPVAAVVTTPSERMVMSAALPPNDHDSSVYVVWGVSTADPQPIGTFDVDPEGDGPVVRQLGPVGGEPFLGYAISLEPGRVAPPSPTTVVASGQVQA